LFGGYGFLYDHGFFVVDVIQRKRFQWIDLYSMRALFAPRCAARMGHGWLPRLKDVVSEISLLTAVQGDADAIVSLGQPHYGDVCDHYDVALISPQQASERLDHD